MCRQNKTTHSIALWQPCQEEGCSVARLLGNANAHRPYKEAMGSLRRASQEGRISLQELTRRLLHTDLNFQSESKLRLDSTNECGRGCSSECRRPAAKIHGPRRRWRECVYCKELFNKSVSATVQQEDDARRQFGDSSSGSVAFGVCPECACFWSWAEGEFSLPDGLTPRRSVKPHCIYTRAPANPLDREARTGAVGRSGVRLQPVAW